MRAASASNFPWESALVSQFITRTYLPCADWDYHAKHVNGDLRCLHPPPHSMYFKYMYSAHSPEQKCALTGKRERGLDVFFKWAWSCCTWYTKITRIQSKSVAHIRCQMHLHSNLHSDVPSTWQDRQSFSCEACPLLFPLWADGMDLCLQLKINPTCTFLPTAPIIRGLFSCLSWSSVTLPYSMMAPSW